MSLRDRVAQALGWTVEETEGFSLQSLRELVRVSHPKLAAELTEWIRTGRYVDKEI